MRALLFALLLSSGACIAEEPGTGGGGNGADAGIPVADADPNVGVVLSVEGLPPETYWDELPVFGHGPPYGTVIVEGPTDTVSAELGVDGSFCIDVPLDKGIVNQIEIVAIDESGDRSAPQDFEVSQFGEPPDPGDPVPSRNIALGGLPTADSTVDEEQNTFPAMTDGSHSTGVMVQNAIFSDDWMILRLPTPDGVETIRIYGDEECLIGDYLVHTAPSVQPEMPAPGDLNEDTNPWVFRGRFGSLNEANDFNVTDCSSDDQPCQEFNFTAAVTGAIGIRFVDFGCGSFAPDEHTINEIEAWTPEGVAPSVITAPSCQGGA
ncbi:MAG: hypothetical protein GY811_24195 [Myxococcales bacterium]|nr:hypothetical protein [Myxococcales bacterium]